jgi:hydroxyacylglutathione hydrolase
MIRLRETLSLKQLTAGQLEQEQSEDTLIVDTRAAEQFASCHIEGALQIGLIGPFASWAAILIKPTQKIILIAEDRNRALEAQSRLARVGFNDVIGYAPADEDQWRRVGIRLASLPIWRRDDVCLALQQGRPFQLVDVRSRAEWSQGHLPNAISIPLLELNSDAAPVDSSKPSLLYCQEGYRAMTAASILLRRTTGDIIVLIGSLDGCSLSWPPAATQEGPEQLEGMFIRVASQEGLERAAECTADPSASLGMTRGEG